MRTTTRIIASIVGLGVIAGVVAIAISGDSGSASGSAKGPGGAPGVVDSSIATAPAPVKAAPIPEFLQKGIDWLAKAQHKDGGWGAGSHQHQDVRDPQAVQSDPATTAFVGLALVRAGSTPTSGAHAAHLQRALEYLVTAVEASGDGPRVTELTDTQPQRKMGPLVDTALTVQFLSRAVPLLPADHGLHKRADAALDKALAKLGKTQGADGTWGRGGWANSLQSSFGAVAYEAASNAGKPVPEAALQRARSAAQGALDAKTGRADATGSAGVELYAWAGAGRNGASQAREAVEKISEAKSAGLLKSEDGVSEANLTRAGVREPEARALASAYAVTRAQSLRLDDATLLQGFGNNGGEEFVSYMMTSEALVMQGGDEWAKWTDKMHGLLSKIQSADGSWTGQHCITSPVFCTAAVVQTLTADRDAAALLARDTKSVKDAKHSDDAK